MFPLCNLCRFLPALGTALGAACSIQTAPPPHEKPLKERKPRTATHIHGPPTPRASGPRRPSSRSLETSSRKHGSTSRSSHVLLLLLPPPHHRHGPASFPSSPRQGRASGLFLSPGRVCRPDRASHWMSLEVDASEQRINSSHLPLLP